MRYTHRIRRCGGNKGVWLLVALRDDGTEAPEYGGYTTALTLDSLLKHSGGLLPDDTDVVQILYYSPDD